MRKNLILASIIITLLIVAFGGIADTISNRRQLARCQGENATVAQELTRIRREVDSLRQLTARFQAINIDINTGKYKAPRTRKGNR